MLHIILQCTRTKDFAKQAINSFKEIVIENVVKNYISINGNTSKKLTKELKFLLNFSNSEYIMFCNNDDLFSPKMATSILHLLKYINLTLNV